MLVGHLAVGMLAKRAEPRVSLGTFIFASLLPDFLVFVFVLAGVEQVTLRGGRGAANYFHAINIGYSHSLLMDVVWGVVLGGAFFLLRRNTRGAWLLFAAVVSHWILDVIAHRPDMPLAPGSGHVYGLGIWASIPASLAVEGGLWATALAVYVKSTRARSWVGVVFFWLVAALLTLTWYSNIAGPPPPNPHAAPIASLILFTLIVLWAYWMNRARPASTVGDHAQTAGLGT
jgi:membrane-bound metal-dependent hydrolase YbcI (DUF457 family)